MSHWPLFDLVVRTPRLELRYPDDALLHELLAVAQRGVHDPGFMPFAIPWTRQPPGVFEREFLKYHWSTRGATSPDRWSIPLVVLEDGLVRGVQDLASHHFPRTRSCFSGSWLGLEHQGRGIGSEMRAAVLALAFEHLGAELCTSTAWHDNMPSVRVSQKVGYVDDGWELRDRDGTATKHLRFRMAKDDWRPPFEVTVEGLAPCLPLLVG